MKKIFTILLVIVITTFFLAGCQVTPEKPVVIQKDMEQMIGKAQATQAMPESSDSTLVQRLGVPDHFAANESYSDRLTLTSDAEIIMPDVASMPVVRVEPEDFSQEIVDKLYNALVGDTSMYQQQGKYTKKQVQDNIVTWQKTLNDPNSAEESKRQAKQEISKLQGLYSSAPEKVDMIPADSEIRLQTEYDFTTGKKTYEFSGVDIAEKPGLNVQSGKTFYVRNNTRNGEITVNEDEFGATVIDTASQGARIYYRNNDLPSMNMCMVSVETVSPQSYTEKPKTSVIFPYENALKMAEKFLNDTGIKDMKVASMTLNYIMPDKYKDKINSRKPTESQTFLNDIASGKYDDEVLDVLIDVDFVRLVNGIPVTNGDHSSYIGDAMFGEQWYYENLKMELCSKGVCSMEWTSPHKITEVVTENTNMLSFGEIKDVFSKMYRVTYEAQSAGGNLSGKVTRVTLTLRRIMDQNNIGYGLFVPAWDFYGTMDIIDEGQTQPRRVLSDKPLLTINAIDGSVINLGKGY